MLGRLNLNSFRVQTIAPFIDPPPTSPLDTSPSYRDLGQAPRTPISFWPPPGGDAASAEPPPPSSSPFGSHLMTRLSSLVGDTEASDRAPCAPFSSDSGSPGSALYFVPSFINHSCEPLLDVLHPENSAVAVFRTRRAVAKDEELTITYVYYYSRAYTKYIPKR